MNEQAANRDRKTFLWICEERWAVLSHAFTAAGFVLAILAGVWAIYEYAEDQDAERVKYTLQLIDNWDTQGYQASYGALRQLYAAFLENLPQEQRTLAETNTRAAENLTSAFNRIVTDNPENREHIRKVIIYFNKLGLCIDAGLCSQKTATVFLNDTVKSFITTFHPYIRANDTDLPGGRLSLEKLSARLNP